MKKICLLKILILIALMVVIVATFASCFTKKDKTDDGKIQLTSEMIDLYGIQKTYTGEAITLETNDIHIKVNERYVNANNFDITYENNINVGTASATFTARDDTPYVYGSATITFEIVPYYYSKYANNYEEFVALTADVNYSRIEVNFDLIIPEGEVIVISDNKSINMEEVQEEAYTRGGTFKNYGTLKIGNGSRVSLGGSRNYSAYLYNYGTIEGEGYFSLYSNCACYNSGEINVKDPITVYGGLYSNQALNVEKKGTGTFIKRQSITSSIVSTSFEDDTTKYNKEVIKNRPTIYLNSQPYYNVTYSNYENVGTASYTINAPENDYMYYGTYNGTYKIVKGDVSFSTYEDFVAYKASGNYASYTQTTSFVSYTNDVTIDADEELIVRRASFQKSFTNKGSFKSSEYLTFFGDLVNEGMMTSTSSYQTASVSGDAYNGSAQNSSASMNIAISTGAGTLYNYGTISLDKEFSLSQNICNYSTGVIRMNSSTGYMLLYKDVENYGNIVSLGSMQFRTVLDNKSTGYIEFAGNSLFDGTDFNNDGRIKNKGKIAFKDGLTIGNNVNFDNSQGTVYAFDTSLNISENFVLKTYLNTHALALSINDVDYDGNIHQATATFDGGAIDETTLTLSKERNNKSTTDFINAGTIKYVITPKSTYTQYEGSVSASYVINLGTTTVSTSSALTIALSNANWGTINLGANIDYTSTNSLTIGETQELHTNGYQLKMSRAGITIKGELYVEEVGPSVIESNIGLYAINSSTSTYSNNYFYVYGKIINSGLVVFGENRVYVRFYDNGEIENSGTIYSTYVMNILSHTTGVGTLYERKALDANHMFFQNDSTTYSVDYNGSAMTPAIKVYDGTTLMPSADYACTYSDNINAGTATVVVSNDNIFNETYYGEVELHFTINKITKNLYSVIAASDFADANNYYKYILTSNATINESFTIPSGIILETGAYRINTKPSTTQYTITLEEGVSVNMDISTYADLNAYWRLATNIKFTTDITSTDTDKKFGLYYTENHRTAVTGWDRKGAYNLTIDLNGHTFDAYMTIQNLNVDADYTTINLAIISSSSTKGIIGSSSYTSYALKQTTPGSPPNGKMNISLTNLTVYGFQFEGNINGFAQKTTTITVNNCGFIGVGTQSAIYAGRTGNSDVECITERLTSTFTNCTFVATQASAACINSGTTTFDGCTFTSTGTYSYAYPYGGNGIVIWQKANAEDRTIVVNVNNSTINANATSGYGILYRLTASSSAASIWVVLTTDNVTYNAKYEKNI